MVESLIIYEWKDLKQSNNVVGLEPMTADINELYGAYSRSIEQNKSYSIGNLDQRNIAIRRGVLHNGGNNVGIIGLGDKYRIEFQPKLDIGNDTEIFWRFLPRMLHQLSEFEDFSEKLFLDPQNNIELPKGCNIVPLLALSYASLCQKVIEKGMLKKHLLKSERTFFIKGRINLSRFVQERPWDMSSMPCVYHEPTFDNPENQIILWCGQKLFQDTKKLDSVNKDLFVLRRLKEQCDIMSTEISLLPKTKADILRINLSGISSYYVELINLCRAILDECLFSFEETSTQRKNTGINFIIDMDWVFEQYMTHVFKEAAKELNKTSNQFKIESQIKRRLCDNDTIRIRPDLIVYKNINGVWRPTSIIDFKWKFHETNNNADYYQVICYGLAELQKNETLNEIDVNLFSVSNESSKIESIDTISEIFKHEKKVHIKKIPLFSALLNNSNPDAIEENIKGMVHKYLESL